VLSADVADKRRSGVCGIDVSEGGLSIVLGLSAQRACRGAQSRCRGIVEVNVGVDSQVVRGGKQMFCQPAAARRPSVLSSKAG
jgi:hypothetical protein